MTKKRFSKVVVVLLTCSILLLSTACQGTPASSTTAPPAATTGGSSPATTTAPPAPTATEAPDTFTFNDFLGASPLTWNPHVWETNADSYLFPYLQTQLVDTILADDGVNFEWFYEGATAITDITATFADKAKFDIPADATEQYVYQIDLNPDLTWEDGTPINADSYIYSMQQQLDPGMKNYRANSYFSGDTAIKNAAGYFNNDKVGEPIYGDAVGSEEEGTTFYFNPHEVCFFLGDTWDAYYGSYGDYFVVNDVDLFEKYDSITEYVEVTDEIKADLMGLSESFGDGSEGSWMEFCSIVTGTYQETKWEDVGLVKTGEYQIVYINEYPVSMFYFLVSCTSSWLVNEAMYEAGKSTVESLVATNYCTDLETSVSFGPYKMVSWEKDKQFVLERNENWYGWNDPRYEGWYQTTHLKVDIVPEHNTALQLFNQGNLDLVDVTSDDMAVYRMSDYLLKTDQTYTFRFIFATSLESLIALEAEANDGANKRVLHYSDFRKAMSLAMDRAKMCAEATPAWKPAYYLFNSLYYYDIENDPESIYRNSTDAKEAVLRLYDIKYGAGTSYATVDDAYNAVTGYDIEAARELFQAAYEQAIADGNYTDGQAININAMVSAAATMTADDTRQQDLMNEFMAEATKGTGFEGKITFTFKSGASTRYDDVALGRIEMIRGAWGGAAFYPFSTVRVYTNPEYMGGLAKIHESNGWDPSTATLDITYNFDGTGETTVTDTFMNWSNSINPGGAYADDPVASMVILSYLETGVLATYQCIPWAAETAVQMFSKKIEYATLNYNIMYGYGGLRMLTFNYSDAEWVDYVASQGGTLNYE